MIWLNYTIKNEVDVKMDNQANLKKLSGVLIAVVIAVILFMTVPVQAANVTVHVNAKSEGTTTLKVTLQNAPDEILVAVDRVIAAGPSGMSIAAKGPTSGFMNLLNVTLKYPNGDIVTLDLEDAIIESTEEQGMGLGYGVPVERFGYIHGFGYGYGHWFGYGYTGNVVDVTLTWETELNDGTYTFKADMPSTLNDRGDSASKTFEVGAASHGGGSSGGLPPLQGQNITIDISSILGATDTLRVGDTVTFTINGETHTGKLISLNSNYAVIEFNSEPVRVTVNVGETKEVDLDADGTNDVSVYLSSITNGDAVFTFSKIVPKTTTAAPTEKVTATAETPAAQPVVTAVQQQAAPIAWTTFAIALVIAAVAVAVVWWVMKTKK